MCVSERDSFYKMGKKKGGKKGKKDKSEDDLPPPPDLDNYKEGAREALLKSRIQDKEETVVEYEEEAEQFKDRNYRQKEKNYDLKTVKAGYKKTLLQQALEYESQQAAREEVSADTVEEALWQKLQLARDIETALEDLEDTIEAVEERLEEEKQDLDKWLDYKEQIVHNEEQYIIEMKQQMEQMKEKELQMESEQEGKLLAARRETEAKWHRKMEKEKEQVSEKLLDSLDKEGRAELVDNGWLKREIGAATETVGELKKEVAHLELRNLKLLDDMQQEQLKDLEISVGLLRASTGHTRVSEQRAGDPGGGGGASPSLPSVVDISKTTNTRGAAGRLGQVERQSLNVQGSLVLLAPPPDSTHLPPLAQQRSSHSALPPRRHWPITANMMDSVTT